MESRRLQVLEEMILLPTAERAAALDGACAGDAALRAEVERLLEVYDSAGAFLSVETGAVVDAGAAAGAEPGAVIGRYTLVERIGEGGFGAVFVAEQREPVVRRVALKIIKLGMDTRQVIARFEAERQALAMMDHPAIARVLDAGATESGRPYFVMELVEGEPITTYCDRERLTIRQRLELFAQVCSAVQHAHQKGVIHRDLKPGNILVSVVDGKPAPKVIDFGIAKAITGRLTDLTVVTEQRQFIGTPEYMSPEQAEPGEGDVDTRTDVYSLGVLLYELLTGTTPLDRASLRSASFSQIQRMIREQDPPRPSTRVQGMQRSPERKLGKKAPIAAKTHGKPHSPAMGATPDADRAPINDRTHNRSDLALSGSLDSSPRAADTVGVPIARKGNATAARDTADIAACRSADPKRLGQLLRGELDWIVMKCLEKDRARRYETANALAMDVRRYLSQQPVEAGPPSRVYRARKFARRNRGGVIAAGLVAAALVLGMIGTTSGLVWALREAKRASAAESEAQERAGELQHVAEFQADQLGAIRIPAMGRQWRIELLAAAAGGADRRGAAPEIVERDLAELERLLDGINFTDATRKTMEKSIIEPTLRAIDERFVQQPLIQARLLQTISLVIRDLGIPDAAMTPQKRALEIRSSTLGDAHEDTLYSMIRMGRLLCLLDRCEEAEPHLRTAMEVAVRELGAEHLVSIRSFNAMGLLLTQHGEAAEAEVILRQGLKLAQSVLGEDDSFVLIFIGNMGLALHLQDRHDEAEECYRQAVSQARLILGNEHRNTVLMVLRLGILLRERGALEEAEGYLLEAIEGVQALVGEGNPYTLYTMGQVADLYDAWHAADPEARHDLKAVEWRARAAASDAPRGLPGALDGLSLRAFGGPGG